MPETPDQERRCFTLPLEARDKVETAEAELSGYAAVFDRETVIAGLFREVIKPGAFAEAIGRDDVRALFNHDANFVLGRTANGTLTLSEDAVGLRYAVTPPGTTWAKDLLTSVKRGDVNQSSFAFRVVSDEWPKVSREEMPLREIRKVELFDVSPVTYPAYEQTTVAARAQATAAREPVPVPVVEPVPDVREAQAAHARRQNALKQRTRELSPASPAEGT